MKPLSVNINRLFETTYAVFSLCIIVSAIFVSQAGATAITDEEVTKSNLKNISIEGFKNKLSPQDKAQISSKNHSISDQLLGRATGETRQERLAKRSLLLQQLNSSNIQNTLGAASLKSQSASYGLGKEITHEFLVYEASTLLSDDIDQDGFYQTFSVIFDVDVYDYVNYQGAEIFAELYVSKDGGPWLHYYTTDNFYIVGDSEDDAYEVITTLETGYATDFYDVLIDVYEVGYDDIVATYSSADSDQLYALPLESADYDPEYYEEEHHHHGGSLSIFILLTILLLIVARRTVVKINNDNNNNENKYQKRYDNEYRNSKMV